jgi:hypothetical protein
MTAPDSVKEPEVHTDPSTGRRWVTLDDYDALRQSLALAQGEIEELQRANETLRGAWDERYRLWEEAMNRAEKAEASLAERRGYVMVPVEPTMGQWDDFCAVHHVPFDTFIKAYKAMLASAPASGTTD